MTLKLTNRATTVLAGSISNSATTLAVQASAGAKFPSLSPGDWFPPSWVSVGIAKMAALAGIDGIEI